MIVFSKYIYKNLKILTYILDIKKQYLSIKLDKKS